jgi:hypothetical protein
MLITRKFPISKNTNPKKGPIVMGNNAPDLFNCLALIKGDLIVIIPNNKHDWEEGLSEVRK